MIASAPKVLALAYYDGATEGFLNGMDDDEVYFFKVVAWDQGQDRRLFLLGRVEPAIYLELLDVLRASGHLPTHPIWIPIWKFENPELEVRANRLVELAKRRLSVATCLALGDDLTSKVEILRPKKEALARAMILASEQTPGDLAEWQLVFGEENPHRDD